MAMTWQDIRAEALRRIQRREWPPSAQIPNEADLAREFGVSRATVNRALGALAEEGFLERRRKAGTRVALLPQRRAQMAIPVIRQEVEARGQSFSMSLIARARTPMPPPLRAALGLGEAAPVERVQTLFLADSRPFAFEDRWVHLDGAPGFEQAPLDRISANEWLVQETAFDRGTLDYSAEPAGTTEARHLGCAEGTPLMILDRRTYGPEYPVTLVRLAFAPGYRVRLEI